MSYYDDDSVTVGEVLADLSRMTEDEILVYLDALPPEAVDVVLAAKQERALEDDLADFARQLDAHEATLGRKMTPAETNGVIAMANEQHERGQEISVAAALDTYNKRMGREPLPDKVEDMTDRQHIQYAAELGGQGVKETRRIATEDEFDLDAEDPQDRDAERQAWMVEQLTPRLPGGALPELDEADEAA